MEKPTIDVDLSGDIAIITVKVKKLYQKVVGPFQEEMVAVVDQGYIRLVVDLSGVDVMNSSGLGVLILLWDRLQKEGGRMIITGLRPLMYELFTRMRLDTLFPVADSRDEAVKLMDQGG